MSDEDRFKYIGFTLIGLVCFLILSNIIVSIWWFISALLDRIRGRKDRRKQVSKIAPKGVKRSEENSVSESQASILDLKVGGELAAFEEENHEEESQRSDKQKEQSLGKRKPNLNSESLKKCHQKEEENSNFIQEIKLCSKLTEENQTKVLPSQEMATAILLNHREREEAKEYPSLTQLNSP